MRAMVCMTAGYFATISSNARRDTRTRSLSRTATTLAVRGSPVSSAISPILSPRVISLSTRPSPATARKRPPSTKKRSSPFSPSANSVSPACSLTHSTLSSTNWSMVSSSGPNNFGRPMASWSRARRRRMPPAISRTAIGTDFAILSKASRGTRTSTADSAAETVALYTPPPARIAISPAISPGPNSERVSSPPLSWIVVARNIPATTTYRAFAFSPLRSSTLPAASSTRSRSALASSSNACRNAGSRPARHSRSLE